MVAVSKLQCEWHLAKGRLVSTSNPSVAIAADPGKLMDGEGDVGFFPLLLQAGAEHVFKLTFHFQLLDGQGRRIGFRDKAMGNASMPGIFGSLSGGQKLEAYRASISMHLDNTAYQRSVIDVPCIPFQNTKLDMSSLEEYALHMKARGALGWRDFKSEKSEKIFEIRQLESMLEQLNPEVIARRLLGDFDLKGISPEEQQAMSDMLCDRFSTVAVQVMIEHMSDAQREAFGKALEDETNREREVTRISAEMAATDPSYLGDLVHAFEEEYAVIRSEMS